MAHLGLICPELSGHLNPMTTLGRKLQRRGHQVTVVARADVRAKAQQAGLGFVVIGEREFPEGAMGETTAQLGRLNGLKAVRFTVELLRRGVATLLREGPDAIRVAKIDALLVDQAVPAGNTVAEVLGVSLVTVCNALAMNLDPTLPPAVMLWRFKRGFFARVRNRAGNAALRWLVKPIIDEINTYRAEHGLRLLEGNSLGEGSALAEIAQQPAFFDYPREMLPECFHYTGPWHDPTGGGERTVFPWEKLDGRPLIYASMGTLQNRVREIFETLAKACAGLDAQLVLSLGSRDQAPDAAFAGAPVVVPFAPQIELLKRATLTITHAGLNTALESLSQGVPMVAIPITNDQPGIASRLEWLGVAEVVAPSRLSVPRLGAAIQRVLREPGYRVKARRYQQEIAHLNGLALAADIVDQAISLREPVLRNHPLGRLRP
jgi:zeaxanthin glucosyltransferase